MSRSASHPNHRRRLARSALLALTACLVVAWAPPAHAQAYPKNFALAATAEGDGASGDASGSFQSFERAGNITMSVRDLACDSSDVYVQFNVYGGGGKWKTPERKASDGCNTSVTWTGLYIHDGSGIKALELRVCVDSSGGDECGWSTIAYNPYYYGSADVSYVLPLPTTADTDLPGPDGVNRIFGQM